MNETIEHKDLGYQRSSSLTISCGGVQSKEKT